MSSKEVGIEEARKRLGDLVTAAQQGTDIVLTRNGKPAARIARHQEDIVVTLDLRQTAATVIARARANSGLTAAEFDYDIRLNGIGGPLGPLGNEAYRLANAHMPDVEPGRDNGMDERTANQLRLWEALQPELEAYGKRCRERKFTNWSNAARDTGKRIQYAD